MVLVISCTFRIPEYRFAGQSSVPKFRTGELSLDLHQVKQMLKQITTYRTDNIPTKGILETEQETIIATRNAEVVETFLTGETLEKKSQLITELLELQLQKQKTHLHHLLLRLMLPHKHEKMKNKRKEKNEEKL